VKGWRMACCRVHCACAINTGHAQEISAGDVAGAETSSREA